MVEQHGGALGERREGVSKITQSMVDDAAARARVAQARAEFKRELESLINRYSIENGSNTPDFLLAEYLMACLAAFEATSLAREKWHGLHLCIGGNVSTQP
jgi:hypothetical protein